MFLTQVSLWLILIIGTFTGSAFCDCDTSKEKECVAGLQKYMNQAGFPSSSELDIICSKISEFRQCLKDYLHSCGLDENPVVQELENVYASLDYVCGDGKKVYLEVGPCLNSADLESKIRECVPSATGSDQSVTCSKLGHFVKCSHDAVVNKCGNEAAGLTDRFVRNMLAMSQKTYNCPTAGSSMLRMMALPVLAAALIATWIVSRG